MSDDQFTKLFNSMTERFNKIEAELATKASKESVDRLCGLIDSTLKRLDENEVERATQSA